MARIYTKTGDDGTTSLIGGKRVSKDTLRVDAYGTVDELNAVLGLVLCHAVAQPVQSALEGIQHDLFTVGASLALPQGSDRSEWGIPTVTDADVQRLEGLIDELETQLEPLRQFVLPGGAVPGALLHLARTVARRAERRCVALGAAEPIDMCIVRYLNRLSDLCFVAARFVNLRAGCQEKHPAFGRRGD